MEGSVVPADLPLPEQSPQRAVWLRRAIVLQPWGETQHAALANIVDRPRRLREEFGFNAIIVLPPAAHNAITAPEHHLTEEQFVAALEAYRRAGYRLILYSAVMHCGHDPEWQSGKLGREHPEWSQRDPRGNPVMEYGAPWLCPNTGARDYTLEYTRRIARKYRADGIMLDNNEFYYTADGWTCYCDACQAKFRDYVEKRFGKEGVRRAFGVESAEVKIPTEKGPLFALWIHWRNRVWAETNEIFRARLREIDPKVLFFCNTQYEWGNGMLSSDLQYEHEDVVLSESRGLTSRHISEKMLLGQALAAGRPLWNYIGTFLEEDFTRLRTQEVVGPIIASSLAHGARPWIVYYGFHDEQGEYRARSEMSSLLSWYASHPELFSGKRWSPVGSVISIRSRDILGRPLFPKHLDALLRVGIPVAALRDEHLTEKTLRAFRVLTLETAACLDESAAKALAVWVRKGGKLVAVPEAGAYDILGRSRSYSPLWQTLGLEATPEEEAAIGKGRVRAARPEDFVGIVSEWAEADSFRFSPEVPVEVIPYRAKGQISLHLVRHEPVSGPVALKLPQSLRHLSKKAVLYAPGLKEPRPLSLKEEDGRLILPEMPVYSVVVIRAE